MIAVVVPFSRRPVAGALGQNRQARLLSATAYVFVTPATILLVLLMFAPLASVFLLSLSDYTLGALATSFVGADNYAEMLGDANVIRALLHTLAYLAIVVPGSVGLGLLIALLVRQRRRSRRVYEIAFFLPVTSTMVAMAVVWQYMLHGRIGPVNAVLSGLGFERIDFLTDPDVALPTLAAIGIWQATGFAMVLFLAGLSSIPQDVYDAAALDGADRGFDRFWRVTWPLLAPTTLFVTVTTSIAAFQVFDTVAVLTRGGPMGSTSVVLYRIYLEAFQHFEIAYASALAVVFLIIIAVLSLAQIGLTDRQIYYAG